MAVVALHSAATGLSALSTEIDVISNNIANVNTAGFKSARVNFEDLIYQQKAQPGVENELGDQRPAGIQVGLGTRVSNTQYDFSIGSPVVTGQPLDMYIEGSGFFRVNVPDAPGGIGYTRSGNFFRNRDGNLVLGNANGPLLDPPISIPEDVIYDSLAVSKDGYITGLVSGDSDRSDFGQVQLATFVNLGGLESIGSNLYQETEASGPPIEGVPNDGVFGGILERHLESSNVDPVKELVSLIKAQRAFELNSQTIQAADETLQTVSNLRRF